MLTSRDYRRRAWAALKGKWGTVAITYFIVMVVASICSGLSVFVIGGLLLLVLSGPIRYGESVQALNVMRGNKVDVSDIMSAQHRMGDTILAYFINGVYTFLWTLLFIIPGIIAAYSYSLTYYLMIDNPKLTPDEARRQSIKLMDGNKARLFKLHLSFIGWIFLSILTLGILLFWIMPYEQCAVAEFYDTVIPTRPTVEITPENTDPFDLNNNANTNAQKSDESKKDEPFYVFEEEMPRDDSDNHDSNISGK
ncbi:MAG: DUF975 family protein [Clostridiales bacterium]|nr:DUF975 family protein [Clostridiales bacterium]